MTRHCDPYEKIHGSWKYFCFSFLKGITTYFSGNCCLEDAELAQKFLDSKVSWIHSQNKYSYFHHSGPYLPWPFSSQSLTVTCNLPPYYTAFFVSQIPLLSLSPFLMPHPVSMFFFLLLHLYFSLNLACSQLFFCGLSCRNCLLTTPVCSRGTMEGKPVTRCAWLQLCRKVRSEENWVLQRIRAIFINIYNTHQPCCTCE